MSTLFINLDELEVIEKVSQLAEEFEVEKDGTNRYVAYLNGGYLPDVYQTEDKAYRAILAEVIGEKRKVY